MNAVLVERAAALEAERSIPTPRRPKPDLNAPYTAAQQARHREELLDDIRSYTRKAKP